MRGAMWSARLVKRAPALRAAVRSSSALNKGADGAVAFHELRERSLLAHTLKAATEGDAASVMHAMDEFWETYYRGQNSTEWKMRGKALEDAIKAKSPATALELGSYCGYSAVAIGRLLPPGAQLVSVEIDPLYAAIATKVQAVFLRAPTNHRHPDFQSPARRWSNTLA